MTGEQKLTKLLKDILPVILNYEAGKVSASAASLKIATRLDEYRDIFKLYLKDGMIWPAALNAILFRISRTGLKFDVTNEFIKTYFDKQYKAITDLRATGKYDEKDLSLLERELNNRKKDYGL